MNIDVKSLHPLEVKVLREVGPDEQITTDSIMNRLGFNLGQCNQTFSWLSNKGYLEEEKREQHTVFELTDLGAEYQEKGTPGERMFTLVRSDGAKSLPQLAAALNLENKDVGSAFGQMSKEGILAMNSEKEVTSKAEVGSERMQIERRLLDRAKNRGSLEESELTEEEKKVIAGISKKRGASSSPFRVAEKEEITYKLSALGTEAKKEVESSGVTGEEIGAVTAEMLSTGSWKGKSFRAYNINSPANRVLLGRKNPYGEFLEGVKDKLVSLGFEEFDGPSVRRSSRTPTHCSCPSSTRHGTFTMCITLKPHHTRKRSNSLTSIRSRPSMRTAGRPEAGDGCMSSIGILPDGSFSAAREQCFPQRRFPRPRCPENISGSSAVSDTIRSMRPISPIFIRPKESFLEKTSTSAPCWGFCACLPWKWPGPKR